jgi:choline dehydrogenase-like flavoprotein
VTERDARDLADGAVISTDVCIVGAGAAGITMGLELAGSGLRVTVLESGGPEFAEDTQDLYVGENVGRDYYELDRARLRLLGGSTGHWEGYCLPLDHRDLTVDPTPQLPGWPLDESELSVHYERAHELCQIGPVDYEPARWARETGTELVALDGTDVVNGVIRRSPPTRFGTEYRDQLTSSPDVEVYLHANVVEILSGGGRVDGVRLAHFGGDTQTVEADVVVLATGGIENPRLLLCSEDERGRQLGNASDLVGRCFMEHPDVTVGYLLADAGLDLSFYTENLPVDEGYARGILTLSEEVRAARGIGNFVGFIDHPPPGAEDQIAGLEGVAGARELQRLATRRGVTPYRVKVYGEQIPQSASRVRLSADRRDALGMPRVELDWRLDPQDERTLRVGTELLAAGIGAAGLGRLQSRLHQPRADIAAQGSYHHMGTTRMSEDPAHGVVDPDGRVHGIDGLYVAGSSVFPSSGFANPTMTLIALALRLAGHLREVA